MTAASLTKVGVSLSRLVFGAWRLLDGCARPDADQVARLIGTASMPAISPPSPSLGCCSPARLVPVLGPMKREGLAAMVKALAISLDRQQWFAILEASEGRPVA
ncbi:hypothetical protein [Mesorhizobium sp. B2-4-17]|uniref:hypothetical protein n=1 Tax=Mesorhizobium sp. B2-4-17 TaxID=2589932 RepID=UPI001FED8ACB|nr:hypothetical protein [Mesorhizobium sp. B2-4-17]